MKRIIFNFIEAYRCWLELLFFFRHQWVAHAWQRELMLNCRLLLQQKFNHSVYERVTHTDIERDEEQCICICAHNANHWVCKWNLQQQFTQHLFCVCVFVCSFVGVLKCEKNVVYQKKVWKWKEKPKVRYVHICSENCLHTYTLNTVETENNANAHFKRAPLTDDDDDDDNPTHYLFFVSFCVLFSLFFLIQLNKFLSFLVWRRSITSAVLVIIGSDRYERAHLHSRIGITFLWWYFIVCSTFIFGYLFIFIAFKFGHHTDKITAKFSWIAVKMWKKNGMSNGYWPLNFLLLVCDLIELIVDHSFVHSLISLTSLLSFNPRSVTWHRRILKNIQ